ncbi:hypothetical protein GCM10010954_10760 [Halobacillus andaensis]|uniref:Lipoprotein n=1 Tax=Halobacillus andaensis TaxID=1176239 RepID=A0A917B071_HALAA|nr:hypothetical protein [Halobacillus andaensis]MBP2003867.1 hypothetical protein [Halobacillus andaensis]GGF13847.1 hypothetical protein GCM10010954_10760 [Halobacillus andaensis]
MRFLVFVVFLLAGCSSNQMDEPPAGKVQVNDQKVDLESGAYQWERGTLFSKETVTTDSASPTEMAEAMDKEKVQAEAEAEISFSEQAEDIQVYLWENEQEMEHISEEGTWTLPSESGEYVYEVLGQWPQGEVSYTMVVQVDSL